MQDKITIADAPDCLNTNDRAMWVLGYEAAIEARGQCLHQIQEPAAAEQAAWHAGLDEGRAQAARPVVVPDDMPSTEANTKYGESYGVDWVYEGKTASPAVAAVPDERAPWCRELPEVRKGYEAFREIYRNTIAPKNSDMAWDAWQYCTALAATPAADAPSMEAMRHCANEWADMATNGLQWLRNIVEGISEPKDALSNMELCLKHCREVNDSPAVQAVVRAAVKATREAAAPVVLPEPALHVSGGQLERHCDPEDKNGGRYIPARKTAAGLFTTPLYTEQQVRALLAQAAIAAAPAHPAEGAQTDLHAAIMNIPVNKAKLENLGINERLQYKIGHRDARHDAAELAVAHAAPQAQADARDAEITWPKARDIGRIGDMSQVAHIRVGFDSDNDVFVSVWDENGGGSIEFCNPGGGGGGQSSRTRMALIALMVAMEADNTEKPSRDWWAQRAAQAAQGGEA
ncbi:hypothetical protein INP81_07300 [Comamonas thiooxydans]|uniref:hypothetical protein n=1 Tax=Comamonas thiooxydans TaxID=363952 RepID=UPI0018A55E60|nr:hypothetical protein [Comamonas thiooxydans]QOQ83673.1 hypothetical protein INP81_07300 [Comamonas thiooxydans]